MSVSGLDHFMADLDAALNLTDTDVSAHELHGHITGVHCTALGLACESWFSVLQGFYELPIQSWLQEAGQQEDPRCRVLNELFLQVLQGLESEDLDFRLPVDESADLPTRLQGVALWCQGFLAGFALAGKQSDSFQDEILEILRDIDALARIDWEGAQEGESQEKDLFEIQEYLKVACLTVFFTMYQSRSQAQTKEEKLDEKLH